MALSGSPSRFERKPKTQKRVVVTGVGVLSPVGNDAESTWKALREGKSGIARISKFDPTGFDCQIAGEVKGFNCDNYVPKKEQRRMDLFIQYSMATAQMAIENSRIPLERLQSPRAGVIVGAGIGGLPGIEDTHNVLRDRGPSRISPFFIPMVISNLASGQIGIRYGTKGPNFCVVSACATGAHSIGEAAKYIRDGICDVMIAGGSESTVCPLAIGGFGAMKALSTRNEQPTEASRPFDQGRDGFVLGEGSAILILEEYEYAEKRGAPILAELSGYGLSCDAHHMTNPSPGGDGAVRSMQMALKDAGLDPSEIGYVNAHGTSTPVGDEIETQAIKTVFGEDAKKTPVSSTKSMTGHLLGAAGSLESVICILALRDQVVPPTINLENPSAVCDLDYVPWTSRATKIQHALNNSFGFGGTNCSVIFSRPE